jgi:hypothetical protein
MTTYEIYIDRQTGTWGSASDLVIATLPEDQVDNLETMSDSEIIEVAYKLEEIARRDLHRRSR